VKREEQVAIGQWIDQTWERGAPGSPKSEFRMAVNMHAQSGESRADAEAHALAGVRLRHPGFTPARRKPPMPILVGQAPSKWNVP
jgi:hypothetical protein